MTVVDASVWVSIFAGDDVHHRISVQWLEQHLARGGRIAAPTLVLVEVAAAMTRRTGEASAGVETVQRLRRLPNIRLYDLSIDEAERAAETAARLRLRGADAVYVATALLLDVPLMSWDRQQRERASSSIEVLTPAEAHSRNT
jgi:predicted nucleic acid-binding protein